MPIQKFALKLFYLGKYEGFQRQPEKPTIEGHLENALIEAGLINSLKSAKYMSAGRTDKGVHAIGQVISINTTEKIIIPALNAHLPKDIIVWAISKVDSKFNPRYEAISRYYRYIAPFGGQNLGEMRGGAELLEGSHDFKLFSKIQPEKSTIREIQQIKIIKDGAVLVFHVRAKSFLWQMVRRIVDCLLKIGSAEWQLDDLRDLLRGNPKPSVYTTPRPVDGLGVLILWDIEYPFQFQPDMKSINQIRRLTREHLKEFTVQHSLFQDILGVFKSLNNENE